MIRLILLCIVFWFFSLKAHPQHLTAIEPDLLKKIDLITIADVPKKSPGVAAAIISGSNTLYERYEGYANLADNTPNSSQTRFNIASNGKQFTALAILILESHKKLSLEDDIRKYFPQLFKKIKEPLTIECLLNHSSGIRDVYDLLSLQGITWWKQTMSNEDVLKLIEEQEALNFVPGTKHLYSNSNYILLALLIEKVSGDSFTGFTKQMFTDLGMLSTTFESDHTNLKGIIAKPYFNFSTWSNYEWIWDAVGDGNLFSTLPDLIHWEKILNRSTTCRISQQVIERSQQLTANVSINNYGYGLEFKNYKGLKIKSHEGATGAWKAYFVRVPERNLSIVTLTNSGKVIPSYQSHLVLDLLLDLKSKVTLPQPSPKTKSFIDENELLGFFTNGSSFYFQFLRKEDGLYLRRNGRNDVKLLRESPSTFRQLYDSTFKQEFTRNLSGEFQVTAYHPSHDPYTLTRKVADWSTFNFQSLLGEYENKETGVSFEIKDFQDFQYTIHINGKKSIGILINPGELIVNSYQIKFEPSSNIKQIYLDGDRIQKVMFERK